MDIERLSIQDPNRQSSEQQRQHPSPHNKISQITADAAQQHRCHSQDVDESRSLSISTGKKPSCFIQLAPPLSEPADLALVASPPAPPPASPPARPMYVDLCDADSPPPAGCRDAAVSLPTGASRIREGERERGKEEDDSEPERQQVRGTEGQTD
jgi:hypothetical protein